MTNSCHLQSAKNKLKEDQTVDAGHTVDNSEKFPSGLKFETVVVPCPRQMRHNKTEIFDRREKYETVSKPPTLLGWSIGGAMKQWRFAKGDAITGTYCTHGHRLFQESWVDELRKFMWAWFPQHIGNLGILQIDLVSLDTKL